MLRSFGCIAALSFLVPAVAEARDIKLACHDENYVCYTDNEHITKCRWVDGDTYDVVVELTADDRYPNDSSPQSVWTGQHIERVRQTLVTLDVTLIESPGGEVGYSNLLRLTFGSITTETTGVTYLRSALRVKDDGTGFACTVVGS